VEPLPDVEPLDVEPLPEVDPLPEEDEPEEDEVLPLLEEEPELEPLPEEEDVLPDDDPLPDDDAPASPKSPVPVEDVPQAALRTMPRTEATLDPRNLVFVEFMVVRPPVHDSCRRGRRDRPRQIHDLRGHDAHAPSHTVTMDVTVFRYMFRTPIQRQRKRREHWTKRRHSLTRTPARRGAVRLQFAASPR
jgi:hypothetical protein